MQYKVSVAAAAFNDVAGTASEASQHEAIGGSLTEEQLQVRRLREDGKEEEMFVVLSEMHLDSAKCLEKLSLAERLVNGLADEYKRWTNTVKDLKDLRGRLIGNCLLASAFVGYISPFSSATHSTMYSLTTADQLKPVMM